MTRPTMRPAPRQSRSSDYEFGCVMWAVALGWIAAILTLTIAGWAAWAAVFWGMARLLGFA